MGGTRGRSGSGPAAVSLPDVADPPERIGLPTANIDLAPTIVDLAEASRCLGPGGTRCRRMDGHSLLGLLRGAPGDSGPSATRGILMEREVSGSRGSAACDYRGIRTPGRVLVHHTRAVSGPEIFGQCEPVDEWESYDLRSDPHQLENDYVPVLFAALTRRLDDLGRCSGIEGRDPRLEWTPFCE